MYMILYRKKGSKNWGMYRLIRTIRYAKNGVIREKPTAKWFAKMIEDANPDLETKVKKL